jgi:transcriptional regulator with XRE-family HTH domain
MVFQPQALTPDRSARHFYGSEVRRYRTNAKMSLAGLAEVVKYSKSQLGRIETADAMPQPGLSEALDAAFGTDGHFVRLYALARREAHRDKYRRRMELEAQARVIEEYSGHVVPGLVQTRDYAYALFRASNPGESEDRLEERVAARLGRQELLRTDPRPHLWIILDEAVTRRPVGTPAVMREQLAVLLPLVETPHTTIQALPDSHGEHALLGGSLTLLTLGGSLTVAYEEGITIGHLIEDPEAVSQHRRAYDLLRAYALSPRDTAAMVKAAMEDLSLCDLPTT